MPISRGIWAGDLKEKIKSDKADGILFAFLRLCCDIESLLSEKLFFGEEAKFELIEKWTLGRLIKENYKLELINAEDYNFLQDFCSLRNIMFHERLMFERVKWDKEFLECIKKATIRGITFLEQNRAVYKTSDQHLEKDYSLHIEKVGQRVLEIKSRFDGLR